MPTPPPGYELDKPASSTPTPPPGYAVDKPAFGGVSTEHKYTNPPKTPSSFFGGLLELGKGAVKGVIKTATALSDPYGVEAGSLTQPANKQQRQGMAAEQFGEYFAPIPGVSGIKAAKGAGPLARAAATAGREALDVGIKSGIQSRSLREGVKSGLIAGPVGAAAEVGVPALGRVLKKAAESQYGRVLHPLGSKAKEAAIEHVPDVLKSGYGGAAAASKEGLLGKFTERYEKIGKELEAEYARLDPIAQTQITPIYEDFASWLNKNAYTATGKVKDQKLVDAGLEKMKEVQAALGPLFSSAPPSVVRDVRKALDKYVFKNGLTADESVQAAAEVREAFANSIRGQLNSQHPTIGALDQQYHIWRSVAELQHRNVSNEFGKMNFARNIGLIGRFMMGAAVGGAEAHAQGAGVMETAGAAALMGLAMESTAWRTVSAVSKNKIADMIAAGNTEAAANMAARLTGVLATRTGSKP